MFRYPTYTKRRFSKKEKQKQQCPSNSIVKEYCEIIQNDNRSKSLNKKEIYDFVSYIIQKNPDRISQQKIVNTSHFYSKKRIKEMC